MLHAAAILIGTFVLALVAMGASVASHALLAAGAIALGCALFALRFGGPARTTFSAPHLLALAAARAGDVLRGALAVVRAAVAADVTLKPALVRVRTRPASVFAQAALADLISAAPGAVVVAADEDGLLVHVTDEDGVDAAQLGALEARVLTAFEGRAP